MSSDGNNSALQPTGRKFVRLPIIVVALLLVRMFVDRLPMIHHASPIAISATLVPAPRQFLARIRVQQDGFGLAFADDQPIGRLPGYIQPVSLADAAIDTLIFISILLGAAELSRQIRTHSRHLPEAGTMAFLVILAVVMAFAYRSYAGVILPFLGLDYSLYAWLFLVLALVPILGAILIGYGKLDVITDTVFHAARRTVGGISAPHQPDQTACSNCGKALAADARFCAACGSPVAAKDPSPAFCKACGAKNEGSAARCAGCGALSAVPT
jgi:hypothetical protein